jgi:alpha-tubulin suppressor-like RCC1 family protein
MTHNGESRPIPTIPELEGDYDIVRELGRGGTAVVYLARERELGRFVAIKLILPAYIRDEEAIARLVREARTVGQLQHPNLVMLFGTRRLGDLGLALILQYVPGPTLKDRIREEGPLPFEDTERILRDLGQALAYAHKQRIVHRDIKPENVYLDEVDKVARLADFGIARAWDHDSALTLPGTAIGTPSYMSPEQVDGEELDGRSDLYSLGLVGHEMLTGQKPWAGDSLYSVMYKQKNEDLPDLRTVRPDVPENLRRAIEGALGKDPDDRWQDAEAFLAALSAGSSISGGMAVGAGVAASGAALPPPDHPAPWAAPTEAVGTDGPDPDRERVDGPPGPRRRARARPPVMASVAAVAALLLAAVLLLGPEGTARSLLDSVSGVGNSPGEWAEWIGREIPRAGGSRAETGADPVAEPGADDAGGPGIRGTRTTEPLTPSASESRFVSVRLPTQALEIRGGEQVGSPGAPLAEPLVLQVRDSLGQGVGGVGVVFEVLSGDGSISPSQGVTASDGTVQTRWILGEEPEEQLVMAHLPDAPEVEVLFRARAEGRAVARTEVVAGAQQEGEMGRPLAEPIRVQVVDGDGSPVPGVTVRFGVVSGRGSVSPESTESDAEGMAEATWVLGPAEGSQEVRVRAEGAPDAAEIRVRATARETAPEPAAAPEAPAAPTLPIRAGVVVGGTHSCSLGSDGTALCWGANDTGQLGDGSRSHRVAPASPVDGGPFATLASGLSHVCGLNRAGEAFCWGSNAQGQLGGEGETRRPAPSPVAGGRRFARIVAGATHTCALTAGGEAFCWGANASGQLGDGSSEGRATPARVASDVAFRELAAGWHHTCGLDAQGRAFCWGSNASGALGSGGGEGALTPRAVGGEERFQGLDAGNAHTCAVASGGQVLCWGGNEYGQLGDGGTQGRSMPAPVDGAESFRAVQTGALHTCALTGTGRALCWGRNLYGQLGDGTTTDRSLPTPVAGEHRFSELHALGSHTCGRTTSGEILCWGYNVDGQLGDGTRENRLVPTPVGGPGS